MKLNKLTPMIWTENLSETVEFYSSVLDFEIVELNEEWGWCVMKNGETGIMFARPNEHIQFEKANFTGSFYFYPDDVDKLWRKLKDKVEIAYPIDDFEYGMREFAIKDNSGYLLQFGQDIKT